MYDCQGLRNGFWLGKQTVNGFFENENFELILFSAFQNFGEASASPVPWPLEMILKNFCCSESNRNMFPLVMSPRSSRTLKTVNRPVDRKMSQIWLLKEKQEAKINTIGTCLERTSSNFVLSFSLESSCNT